MFLKTDFLEAFFTKIHPYITAQYILITHNSDYPAPGPYRYVLDDHRIIAWFAQNCQCLPKHAKLRAIPIGLENYYWKSADDFAYLRRRAQVHSANRSHLLYVNFGPTNPKRMPLLSHVQKSIPSAFVVTQRRSFQQYVSDIASSIFVLSPPGNGLDCHRTWEVVQASHSVTLHETTTH